MLVVLYGKDEFRSISEVKELFSCLSQITDEEYRGKFDEIIRAPEHIATLAAEMGFRASFIKQPKNVDQTLLESLENEITMELEKRPWPVDLSKCHPRPPVVTIMGHVDHGKTTLLDYLRKSEIVKSEFGGITQHIGAFSVKMQDSSNIITFLDTPGHAAFKSMRARGARVTDMVVLVVAADDGIMEQTVESIKFARDASVPIIVAISKCDKRNVDIQSVKLQLMSHNLVPEEYGGEVQVVPISALKGTGIEQLKEAIMTQAEIMDLRAETDGPVEAAVIESKTIHGKGKAASLLIRRGTLKKGRFIVAGQTYCCVRAMYDQQGNTIAEASPSTPVEVTGWKDELPSAGDEALEVETEKRAKDVVGYRKSKNKDQRDAQDLETVGEIRKKERELYTQIRLENIEAEIKNIRIRRKRNKMAVKSFRDELKKAESNNGDDDSKPEFNIIVKADVHGSLEAILEVCNTYNSGKCDFDVIYTGVGPVTGNDLELAETFKATIYAFNTATPSNLLQIIKIKQISLKPFNIIYRMVEDLKTELSNRLPPVDRTDILGEATVLRSFKVPGKSGSKRVPVAGCRCTKGTIVRKAKGK
uniref:Tr-type G domain-containing protein n=1 Tax=Romanomermis culicivorax TaxID=13658 RepID=A0A915J8G3_ROMCU